MCRESLSADENACEQAVYAIEIFYYFTIFFLKMSILFLYLRMGEYAP